MNSEIHIDPDKKRTTGQKLSLFRSIFRGREDVHGAFDFGTGRGYQVKKPVTDRVVLDHLSGKQMFGFYPLAGDRICVAVVDFDTDDANQPLAFVAAAKHYGLSSYIERSKSKGHHAWTFFETSGVLASKARLVVLHILEEIGRPNTEVFPKQDALDRCIYGNFINAPLYGRLVPEGKTVFLDPGNGLDPYPNQWDFLEGILRVSERGLDEIVELNGLADHAGAAQQSAETKVSETCRSFGLPLCAQKMLAEGVTEYQRVACFRLAVDLKKAGVPLDAAIAALNVWALKNRPADGKGIITRKEIMAQAAAAYDKGYRACGCSDPAVKPYCVEGCHLATQGNLGASPQAADSKQGSK